MVITWVGGHRTETRISRPVRRLTQLSYYADLLALARVLQQEGQTHAQIAAVLNAEGWAPAKRRATFNASMITSLFASAQDAAKPRDGERPPATPHLEHEWALPALAHALGMSAITLHSWVRRGWAKGRKVPSANPVGRWLLWADEAELTRLRALSDRTTDSLASPGNARLDDLTLLHDLCCHRPRPSGSSGSVTGASRVASRETHRSVLWSIA